MSVIKATSKLSPAKTAALRIWNMVNEQGQDALSNHFYEKVIEDEFQSILNSHDALVAALKAVQSTCVGNGDLTISYAIDGNVARQILSALALVESQS